MIGVVNYVIAARPSLLNFMIADSTGRVMESHTSGRVIRDWLALPVATHRILPAENPA